MVFQSRVAFSKILPVQGFPCWKIAAITIFVNLGDPDRTAISCFRSGLWCQWEPFLLFSQLLIANC